MHSPILNAREACDGFDTFRRQLREIPAFRALLRAVEARFYAGLPITHPVLDLGCGDGHFASVAFPQKLDVGLDPWLAPLREAHRTGGHRLLTRSSGTRMPFATDSFATVISNSVLEHIASVDPVLQEVSRVLKPGGWFYFSVPGPNFRRFLSVARALDSLGLEGLAEAYRCLFDRISRHYHYAPASVWAERLERSGLHVARWWTYFSPQALTALEWGHLLGVPSLVAKKLTGRWILVPTRWNLWLTEVFLRRYYEEPLPAEGAYLFFVARKGGSANRARGQGTIG